MAKNRKKSETLKVYWKEGKNYNEYFTIQVKKDIKDLCEELNLKLIGNFFPNIYVEADDETLNKLKENFGEDRLHGKFYLLLKHDEYKLI